MNTEIVKCGFQLRISSQKHYLPVIVVIKKKIYTVQSWHMFFKVLLYSNRKNDFLMTWIRKNLNKILPEVNYYKAFVDDTEESFTCSKFAKNLYCSVFEDDADNMKLLKVIKKYLNEQTIIYYAKADTPITYNAIEDDVRQVVEKLLENGYVEGTTSSLVAQINRKVLTDREKFIKHIEREFNQKSLIGDISIKPEEEPLLKEYMNEKLKQVIKNGASFVQHEKVLAFGLVRVALKYYKSKRYWPYLEAEYDVVIPANYHNRVNVLFRRIMQNNNKCYDDNGSNFVQNMCMHAFLCNQCADQFFDYVFDFWRVDLSKSLDNLIDDNGNDLFDVLIDEIDIRVQDVMLHTTMALKNNPTGSKNRFRRILKMIEDSYWENKDYSNSKNRINQLFEEWKGKPNSHFNKVRRTMESDRKKGNKGKMFSKPTLLIMPEQFECRMALPKQFLIKCKETEHPKWYIKCSSGYECSLEPELMMGKLSYYVKETEIPFSVIDSFGRIQIVLKSEERHYMSTVINQSDVRFFKQHKVNVDISNGVVSPDVDCFIAKQGHEPSFLNEPQRHDVYQQPGFTFHLYTPTFGDVILLKDGHALSVGRPIVEGMTSNSIYEDVKVNYQGKDYTVISKLGNLFFKTNPRRLNGTSIVIQSDSAPGKSEKVKVVDRQYQSFKLDDRLEENYGYFINLDDYISKNGIYKVILDIPGLALKEFRLCYIKGFSYEFDGAPYVLQSFGKISVSKNVQFQNDANWEATDQNKTFGFSFSDEHFVDDDRLKLKLLLNGKYVDLYFKLPILFWKYHPSDEWNYLQPEEVTLKTKPDRIYVRENINIESVKLMILDQQTKMPITTIGFNSDDTGRYFRMMDFSDYLNREQDYQNIFIKMNGKNPVCLLKVVCRSIIAKKPIIFGDALHNRMTGHFEINGTSEYTVTIRYQGETKAEDIPVINGDFEVELALQEGDYELILYEIEEDDSGFGFDSVAYELRRFTTKVVDVRKFTNRKFEIAYIRDREHKFTGLRFSAQYTVKSLQLLDYKKDIEDKMDLFSYLYELDDPCLKDFIYYKGLLVVQKRNGTEKKVGSVLVVFDDINNLHEVLLMGIDNVGVDEDEIIECNALIYEPEERKLYVRNPRIKAQYLQEIDDDKFRIGIRW